MQNSAKILADFLYFSNKRAEDLSRRPDGRFILMQEKRLRKKLNDIWVKQMNYVLEASKQISAFQKNALEDEVDRVSNNIPHKQEMIDVVIEYMEASMQKGGDTSVKILKLGEFGISFKLTNKKAVDFLNAKKNLELSNYKGNIHNTTKDRIKEILLDAAKTGQSYQKTAELIQQQGEAGVFSPARGELIATREIGVSYETGNNIPIVQFQEENPDRSVVKEWQTVNDDRVTEECMANQDEGQIDVNDAFSSGDQHAPREGNPRCRCFTAYEIQA